MDAPTLNVRCRTGALVRLPGPDPTPEALSRAEVLVLHGAQDVVDADRVPVRHLVVKALGLAVDQDEIDLANRLPETLGDVQGAWCIAQQEQH